MCAIFQVPSLHGNFTLMEFLDLHDALGKESLRAKIEVVILNLRHQNTKGKWDKIFYKESVCRLRHYHRGLSSKSM